MSTDSQKKYAKRQYQEYKEKIFTGMNEGMLGAPDRIKLLLCREGLKSITFGGFVSMVEHKQFDRIPGVGKKLIEAAESWIKSNSK